MVGLVRGDAHVEVRRQELGLGFLNDAVDFIGSDDEVLTCPFSNVERHHGIPPFSGETGGFLVHKTHVGHVAEVDRLPSFGLDNDGLQVLGVAEVTHDLNGASAPIHEDVSSGNGQVFLTDGLGDIVEADEHGFGPKVVHFDLHFFGVDAPDFGFVDLLNVFNAFLKNIGVVLELVDGVISRKVDLHDRYQLREVQVKDVGVTGQIIGKAGVAHGDVHLVLDLSQCHLWCHREVELDVNGAIPLLARGDDFIDARDAFELFFNGAGDELLDVPGTVARVGSAYKDFRNDHFGEALLGHGDVGGNAGDQNDHDQDRHGGAVFNRCCAQAEFLGLLRVHGVGVA